MFTDPKQPIEAAALSGSGAPARAETGAQQSLTEAWPNQGLTAGPEL